MYDRIAATTTKMNPLVLCFIFFCLLFIVALLQPLITCQLLCWGWHVSRNAYVTRQDVYVRGRAGFVGQGLFTCLFVVLIAR